MAEPSTGRRALELLTAGLVIGGVSAWSALELMSARPTARKPSLTTAPRPEVRAEPRLALRGQVTYASGRPASNLPVSAEALEGPLPRSYIETTTGPMGTFTLEGLVAIAYSVEVRTSRSRNARSRGVAARGGQNEPVRIVLEDPVRIRGRVVDAKGAPLARVRINGVQQTFDDGTFDAEIPAETRRLFFDLETYGTHVVPLSARAGESRALGTVRLELGCTLSGRVTQDSRPVSAAWVSISTADHGGVRLRYVRTADDGTFRETDLEAGTLRVHAEHPDGQHSPVTHVKLRTGTETTVELPLGGTGTGPAHP